MKNTKTQLYSQCETVTLVDACRAKDKFTVIKSIRAGWQISSINRYRTECDCVSDAK